MKTKKITMKKAKTWTKSTVSMATAGLGSGDGDRDSFRARSSPLSRIFFFAHLSFLFALFSCRIFFGATGEFFSSDLLLLRPDARFSEDVVEFPAAI